MCSGLSNTCAEVQGKDFSQAGQESVWICVPLSVATTALWWLLSPPAYFSASALCGSPVAAPSLFVFPEKSGPLHTSVSLREFYSLIEKFTVATIRETGIREHIWSSCSNALSWGVPLLFHEGHILPLGVLWCTAICFFCMPFCICLYVLPANLICFDFKHDRREHNSSSNFVSYLLWLISANKLFCITESKT